MRPLSGKYYRGTQNKRNAYIEVILVILIFQKFEMAKMAGFFKIGGISRYPHDRPCVTHRMQKFTLKKS